MIQSTSREKIITVGLGELHAAKGADVVLVAFGLGSCVAVCGYDPVRKVGGMAHTVLPSSSEGSSSASRAKFVDMAVPMLLQRMEELGAARRRLIVRIVGGAQAFAVVNGNAVASIGDRNVQAAKAALADLGLHLSGDDTGGAQGRTVRLYVGSGKLTVSTMERGSYEL